MSTVPAGDIAIIGYSFRLPQDVNDDGALWETLQNRKNMMTDWPATRINAESFKGNPQHKFTGKGAHFVNDDMQAFDAPFFSVTAKEAASMDPMQRWTLEASYRALENAGIPAENLRGSRTAVFSASMLEDYSRMTARDPDNIERMAATGGTVACIIPNRVSWYFDFRGPSIHVNTACSSSMSALDMACKSLQSGDASCALVTGCNIILDPGIICSLSDQNFLSPDGLSYSFDHRANGYARGEGVMVLVLKPVAEAIRNGDMIRAIIRSIASNQDGHTPILTQPSAKAQEDLIRHVYAQANLSFDTTRYVEAHGTGTKVGDPIEMKAIGRVFRKFRSVEEPLYVGSIKANFGHLEGASALASVLKSIAILERGIIPPNALFEKINPEIDTEFYNTIIPTTCVAWPSSGLRRVSVNSFGFGGSNTHVVLDDAYHYLKDRGLVGNHNTVPHPMLSIKTDGTVDVDGNKLDGDADGENGHADENICLAGSKLINGVSEVTGADNSEPKLEQSVPMSMDLPKLLVFSAADEKTMKRMMEGYESYFTDKISNKASELEKLAYTLSDHRSRMLWRSYALATTNSKNCESTYSPAKPVRSSADVNLAFVFTGQGAQYVGMGRELIQFPVYQQTLHAIDKIYTSLGCSWSILVEEHYEANIDHPEYSQPLSTAIQLAIVNLLKSFNLTPKAVVGHSSGEIAAAYSIGALSLESACKVAYFRGQLAGKLKTTHANLPGAMMSINVAANEIVDYIQLEDAASVCVACVNSPTNCTLSGPEDAIDSIKSKADKDGIFAQKLKTGVAYHSNFMKSVADEYLSLMGSLQGGEGGQISMVSSVSGKLVTPAELSNAQYWVDNMVSPVQFADAIQVLTQNASTLRIGLGSFSDIVEIGPHPALRRVALDTIRQEGNRKTQIRYGSVLHRTRPAVQNALELVGQLFCLGHEVSISAVNQRTSKQSSKFLLDCPEYPFDRSHRHWAESRISRDYRLRGTVQGETLGVRALDWNPLEPCWRNFLTTETTPWSKDHMVDGTVIFPAMGMLVMAMEAVYQVIDDYEDLNGYFFQRAEFKSPIIIQENWEDRIETKMHLRKLKESQWYEATLYTYSREQWTECFRATLRAEYDTTTSDTSKQGQLSHDEIRDQFTRARSCCKAFISPEAFYRDAAKNGNQWGPSFQLIKDIFWDEKRNTAIGKVTITKGGHSTRSLVHPAILDQAFQVLRLSGGQQPSGNVPVRIQNAWFASSGWQAPHTNSIRLLAKSTVRPIEHGPGNGEDGSIHALADDGKVLCSIQKAVTSSIARNKDSDEKHRLAYSIEWKPQLDLLTNKQLELECLSQAPTRDESLVLSNHLKINNVLVLITGRVLKKIDASKVPEKLSRHVRWLEKQVQALSQAQIVEMESLSDEQVESRLCEIEDALPFWGVVVACARNLESMLIGEADPLHIVFDSDQAHVFYETLFLNLCSDGRLFPVLELASHQNPGLQVIEIGAGTGGMTRHLLKAWGEREKRTGVPSFGSYTYTDISPMFFEKASNLWSDLVSQGRISFKTLDLTVPIEEQGFKAGTYDLLVAGSVMHATPDLELTIRNVRKLLRPGGKLVLLETTKPSDIAVNFMAGLVPGWWVATEEWRADSAAVDESVWDRCLRNNGFSGNDLVIRDYETEECHIMSIIITTATEGPTITLLPGSSVVVVIDGKPSDQQTELATELGNKLCPGKDFAICAFCPNQLQEAATSWNNDTIVIIVAEVNNRPVMANLDEDGLMSLQILTKHAQSLLWVTGTSYDDREYPDYSLIEGFLRTIRAEQLESHIVNIAIEDMMSSDGYVNIISTIFNDAFGSVSSKELEYRVRNGMVTIGRVVENVSVNKSIQALISPQEHVKAWAEGPGLQLSIGNHGDLSSLRFVEDTVTGNPLGPHEIEIEARAWGLGKRELESVVGKAERDQDIGSDCAGVVTGVGSDCVTTVRKGDRVFMSTTGCVRKNPRALETSVIQIPDSLSFEDAASIIMPTLVSHYSLFSISQLNEGEKILIHDATDIQGQSAVYLAQRRGVEVFATVSSEEQQRFLVENSGLAEDHIFFYQAFADGISRATKGQGVDVVFSLVSYQDVLQASLECLSATGYFVDASCGPAAVLPLELMKGNMSFIRVDILSLTPRKMSRLLYEVLRLLQEKSYHISPVSVFGAHEIEHAFQKLQDGQLNGRAVVLPKNDDLVSQFSMEKRPWLFRPDASYLVAGGTGGLGRGIITWMVGRGARHFIVPSRSGATSESVMKWASELGEAGVSIITPCCDVACPDEFAKLLQDVAAIMPPIKGCINGAMVLRDSIFQDNMTFAQWETTVRSKVQTSWTLHRLLPKDLDFFIMLSSVAGVMGQLGSANYSAGCAFQDAIVRYRLSQGCRALSIDLGYVINIGIVVELSLQRQQQIANDKRTVTDRELFGLLTMCCDPEIPFPLLEECMGQVPFGVDTPARYLTEQQAVPLILDRPLFSAFSELINSNQTSQGTSSDQIENAVAMFHKSSDSGERVDHVIQALAAKLGRAMSIPPSDIEPSKPLSAYGVDSLMAVELRNWIGRELGASVAVFDIVGSMPISNIADLITAKSGVGRNIQ